MFYVQCRVETYLANWNQFSVVWAFYKLFNVLLIVMRLEDWNLASFCIDDEIAKGPALAEE